MDLTRTKRRAVVRITYQLLKKLFNENYYYDTTVVVQSVVFFVVALHGWVQYM